MATTRAPLQPDDAVARQARDRDFADVALPLLPTIARVAAALTDNDADADDLVQEAFLRAYRHWHTFTPGSDAKSWLSTIARNAFFEQRRKESRSINVDDQELESLASARAHNVARSAGLDDMYSRLDLGPAIERAIANLEPHYRDIVLLVDVDGMQYDQVAAALDIPIGTVRSRLYRARRLLQDALISYAIDAGFSRGPGDSTIPTQSPRTV